MLGKMTKTPEDSSSSDSVQESDSTTSVESGSAKKSFFSKSAPPEVLSGRSFLEEQCHWLDYPDYLVAAHDPNPMKRLLLVVQWYLSALSGLYKINGGKTCKPYNPVLGETLHVKMHDPASTWQHIEMLAEQVSHHPPRTAFHFENTHVGFSFSGTIGDRPKFRGTHMKVEAAGSGVLHLGGEIDEDYLVCYPTLEIRGVISGRTTTALTGTVLIECPKTNLGAKLKFEDNCSLEGAVGPIVRKGGEGKIEKVSVVLSGTHNKDVYAAQGANRGLLWQARPAGKESRKYFKPMRMLGVNESWRVWEKVTYSLAVGDFESAGTYKSQVEEKQRRMSAMRKEQNTAHTPVLFAGSEYGVKDAAWVGEECREAKVWPESTLEVSLPVITRVPPKPDMM
eukprot:comp20404_c0_seq1/m.25825 comp20404_c0_seq1/g.25825  ORF comp20404_c0_seq1/g.25825 comp20404_c0_seq1/m.25825 type:complete len:395 (-) comp20404_c0_seq1:722-1906(-)